MPFKADPKKKTLNGGTNGNILNFFKKVPKPQEPHAQNHDPQEEEDDDLIAPSPEKSVRVLENVTNHSPPHSTQIEPVKKRRGSYPDDIPEMDVVLPQRKKPCTIKNGIKVVALKDISQEEFKTYQQNLQKPTPTKSALVELMKTPDKKPSPSKKNLSSGKRKTPCKLFHQSPQKTKDFKVQILQNFVRITPSKSERNENEWVAVKSPMKSVEKKQQVSIREFASPTSSARSHNAKSANETTPVTIRPSHSGHTPSGKAKVKLDFTLSNTYLTVLNNKENGVDEVKQKTPKKSPFKVDHMFDDSWDGEMFKEDYNLDLSIPQHCKVTELTRTASTITIVVQSTKTEDKALCHLTSLWVQTYLEIGSIVYIQAQLNELNEYCINNNNGLLVFEPDYLVSSTTLVGAVFCKRKCVLRERFSGFEPQNKVMMVGSLVHSLLQESLKRNLQSDEAIAIVAHQLLTSRESVRDMFESSLTAHEVHEEIRKFIPRIKVFMQQYLASNTGKYPAQINPDDWRGKIDTISDIEENIWCPELGIKGKVDVSVKVGQNILPLELKTGRASMSLEHRGQVILYIMMMNKLGYKVTSGLLLYLREGVLRDVPMNDNEKRDLIIMRNEIVYYLTRLPEAVKSSAEGKPSQDLDSGDWTVTDIEELIASKLPPPIDHHSACGRCEYNVICGAYLRKENINLDNYSRLKALQPEVVGHLTEKHISYFTHWCALLALENNVVSGKSVREIYLKAPEDREKQGRCLTNMRLDKDVTECNGIFCSTFHRSCESVNLLAAGIMESNYVIVSTKKRPAVASGIVSFVDYKSITIELDRDLSKKYVNTAFILDTYDSSSANTFNFTNLSVLLQADDRAAQLRRLIIDKEAPQRKKTLPKSFYEISKPILKTLNTMQQRAIIRAIAANDYLLIKGMPGTGKTATIVSLVVLLVKVNYTVLITSHTHSAVDNVCLRLLACGVKLLRLGAESRIHPDLKEYSEHYLTKNCKTPEELDEVYNRPNVLAVTCLGSKHPLLSKRTMDFCIVDESTQVLQCSVIRALHSSKKFILVGDPDQLPPVIKNQEALERGMSESLFERLQEKNEATVTLQLNYRMNKTITALANNLTYNGQLLLANDKVANANLRLPDYESMVTVYNSQWLLNALSDELDKAVYLLDTGPVWNKVKDMGWLQHDQASEASKCVNPSECAIVFVLTQALLKGGLRPSNIGIIAPYRAQVAQIAEILQPQGVDVSTVDQFQGKDKEVIIYSCTKSRDVSKPRRVSKFEILEDQRRLTVAVTRAKHKFIVIADVATIREYSPFAKLFSHIDRDSSLQLIDGSMGFSWEQVMSNCKPLTTKT